jgi:hypothetical protein
MTVMAVSRRRWRPRWLTTRAIVIGAAFTIAIFAFALSVAAYFAGQTTTVASSQPRTQIATPAPVQTEPNDR